MKTIKLHLLIISLLLWFFWGNIFAQNQLVVVGYLADNPPYSSVDSDGYGHGFGISLMQILCRQMDVQCVFRPYITTDLIAALRDNKIDVAVGGITITPDREKFFNFTLPILPDKASFIGLKTSGQVPLTQITVQNLENKTIGARIGSFYPPLLKKEYSSIKTKEYEGSSQLIAALVSYEADFVIMDTPSAEYWVNQAPKNLYIAGSPIFMNTYIGMMLNKSKPQLLSQLNIAIFEVTQTPEFLNLVQTFFPDFGKGDSL